MRNWVRRWLGLDDVYWKVDGLQTQIRDVQKQLGTVVPGMGRIIAKLDPLYAQREDDPSRVRASNDLGDEVIKRLKGEDEARRKMEGK